MFDPDDIDGPDIFGDLGRNTVKGRRTRWHRCRSRRSTSSSQPSATCRRLSNRVLRRAAAEEISPNNLAVMQQVSNQTGIPWQILAAISQVESGFGANMGPSSAGAIGYCQFMPGTWAAYRVDGDGDGIADPYNFATAFPRWPATSWRTAHRRMHGAF
jgi:membrane-bound lytic murein transglycosylase B